ncbi:MAG: hypothetical protein XD78_0223 [Desulfotomaculum sp. 46_296]|nr:MAG: hypothetical protein XD78_0223 [Desulfotomaculum sp. 46_296]KUK84745.1 MAG: hypothetical protein XE00_0571 [Desulfofundulus kuznetsovii]
MLPMQRQQKDENSSAKGGQCLKCDFEPSFEERVNPGISEVTV